MAIISQELVPATVGLLTAINAWQVRELYKLNREVGRITSDSESEKATRARVNREILKRLSVPESDIKTAVEDPIQARPHRHQPKSVKRFLFLLALIVLSIFLMTGCGLLPKKVEFFQDKVAKFPEQKPAEKEVQRQTALRAHERADETVKAALATQADVTVIRPAVETELLTDAVSESLGPPKSPANPEKPSEALATELRGTVAKLNARLDSFKADNNENAGKKIEGTGLFQVGYFTMWFIALGVIALIWFGLKVYGMINPVVGMGTNVVGRVSSTLLKKGVSELAEGGEWFKEYLKESHLADDAKKKVLELFSRAHVEAQSRDTQNLVEKMTL